MVWDQLTPTDSLISDIQGLKEALKKIASKPHPPTRRYLEINHGALKQYLPNRFDFYIFFILFGFRVDLVKQSIGLNWKAITLSFYH